MLQRFLVKKPVVDYSRLRLSKIKEPQYNWTLLRAQRRFAILSMIQYLYSTERIMALMYVYNLSLWCIKRGNSSMRSSRYWRWNPGGWLFVWCYLQLYAKTVKRLQHLLENPELFESSLNEMFVIKTGQSDGLTASAWPERPAYGDN